MRPRVVMPADVSPKEMPVRKESIICLSSPSCSSCYISDGDRPARVFMEVDQIITLAFFILVLRHRNYNLIYLPNPAPVIPPARPG